MQLTIPHLTTTQHRYTQLLPSYRSQKHQGKIKTLEFCFLDWNQKWKYGDFIDHHRQLWVVFRCSSK